MSIACTTSGRHWFTYYGEPGTSAPVCVRYGCSAPNPGYDSDRDPYSSRAPKSMLAQPCPYLCGSTDPFHDPDSCRMKP